MGLTLHTIWVVVTYLVVLLVQVLLHVDHVGLGLGLHLKVTTAMEVLTDANSLAIDSVDEGSRGAR